MKKIIFSVVALAGLSLASCQKDRTCTCDVTATTNGNGVAWTQASTVGHTTKKEAKRMTECYSTKQTETETIMGTVYTTVTESKCELK